MRGPGAPRHASHPHHLAPSATFHLASIAAARAADEAGAGPTRNEMGDHPRMGHTDGRSTEASDSAQPAVNPIVVMSRSEERRGGEARRGRSSPWDSTRSGSA